MANMLHFCHFHVAEMHHSGHILSFVIPEQSPLRTSQSETSDRISQSPPLRVRGGGEELRPDKNNKVTQIQHVISVALKLQ